MTIREALDRRVSKVGLARALIYLVLGFVLLLSGLETLGPILLPIGAFGPVAFLAVLTLLFLAITVATDALCFADKVRCPRCNGSLWPYLEKKGIKRRWFRLPSSIGKCPLCGADFAEQAEVDFASMA